MIAVRVSAGSGCNEQEVFRVSSIPPFTAGTIMFQVILDEWSATLLAR
jgi:hypothetical protein